MTADILGVLQRCVSDIAVIRLIDIFTLSRTSIGIVKSSFQALVSLQYLFCVLTCRDLPLNWFQTVSHRSPFLRSRRIIMGSVVSPGCRVLHTFFIGDGDVSPWGRRCRCQTAAREKQRKNSFPQPALPFLCVFHSVPFPRGTKSYTKPGNRLLPFLPVHIQFLCVH